MRSVLRLTAAGLLVANAGMVGALIGQQIAQSHPWLPGG